MKTSVLILIALTAWLQSAPSAPWQPPAGYAQIPIWPGTPPDAQPAAGRETQEVVSGKETVAGKPWIAIRNVSRPTVTLFPPKTNNTGAAVLVLPGGGYTVLAIDLEGTEVCEWLNGKGITCVLLKYRVPDSGPAWHEDCKCNIKPNAPTALEDTQRAMRLVRSHAAEWHIDPHKIGVLGFSAGGHLSAAISTRYDERLYPAADPADRESARPDFSVVLYPGHLWAGGARLKPDIRVTPRTPPTFLLQAEDDPVDSVQNSLVYHAALRQAGVPVEMHLFARAGHAFGLRPTSSPITQWPRLAEAWLRTIAVVSE